tara:strand:- start:4407 stop:4523 length:117 start_codon:yes stop_codon:yes gene_type:complete
MKNASPVGEVFEQRYGKEYLKLELLISIERVIKISFAG